METRLREKRWCMSTQSALRRTMVLIVVGTLATACSLSASPVTQVSTASTTPVLASLPTANATSGATATESVLPTATATSIGATAANSTASSPTQTQLPAVMRTEVFEAAWELVSERFVDPQYNGVAVSYTHLTLPTKRIV